MCPFILQPAGVCQVRLDFISMVLASADTEGQCMVDRLSINGATPTVPPNLCGTLTGQHSEAFKDSICYHVQNLKHNWVMISGFSVFGLRKQ